MFTNVLLDYGGLIVNYDFNRDTLLRAHSIALKAINSRRGCLVDLNELSNAHDRAIKEYLEARKSGAEWSMNVIMGIMLENLGLEEFVSDKLMSQIYETYDHDASLMPTAKESIPELRNLGKLGIISNLPHNSIKYELRRLGLEGVFNPVVISHEVRYRKPHPAIYREALARARITPLQGVFFSHDQEEVEGALAVGMQAHLAKNLGEVLTKLKTSIR